MTRRRLILISVLLIACAFNLNAQTIQEKIAECEKYWDSETLNRCNTAKDFANLSDFQRQTYYFLNLARVNGPLFSKTFVAAFCDVNDVNVRSLIDTLSHTIDYQLIYPDKDLLKAAQSHADDKEKNSHTSGDGTGATQRLRIKFRCSHYSGECIAWGGNSNGIQPVLQLLVDGGHAPGYGHRTILLSKSNATMGVGTGYEKDGHHVCVIDMGFINNEMFLNHVYSSFPQKMIKAADVARNVDYLSKKEKDLLMVCNLARIDVKMFHHIMFENFAKYELENLGLMEEVEAKFGTNMTLLYPDRKMQRGVCADLIKDNWTIEDPVLTEGESLRFNWAVNKYGNVPLYSCTVKLLVPFIDPVNRNCALKFALNSEKDAVFFRVMHSVTNNEFSNQDKIVTLADVMGANYNYLDEDIPQPPHIQPPTENINIPVKIMLDAVTDDGGRNNSRVDNGAENYINDDEDDDEYYDDEDGDEDGDEDDDDDDDDDYHHHHPGYHHHPGSSHHHYYRH